MHTLILAARNYRVSKINSVATSLTEGRRLQVCPSSLFHSTHSFCARIPFAFSPVVSFEMFQLVRDAADTQLTDTLVTER